MASSGTRSLGDDELEMMLLTPAPDAHTTAARTRDLRERAAVGLIAEYGFTLTEVVGLTVTACEEMYRRIFQDTLMVGVIDALLDATRDGYLLRGDALGARPDVSRKLLWSLCMRCGARRGIPGVSPQRLRVTYMRRRAEAGDSLAMIAKRAGVAEISVRRALEADAQLWARAHAHTGAPQTSDTPFVVAHPFD